MTRSIFALAVIALVALPSLARAQDYTYEDMRNPNEYRDVEDGQALLLLAYVLTPIGMGLEWGLMRPLHYAATQTAIAPLLSGDKEVYQFGQNNNADLVPPGTFDPPPLNLTNDFVHSPETPAHQSTHLRGSQGLPSYANQPVMH